MSTHKICCTSCLFALILVGGCGSVPGPEPKDLITDQLRDVCYFWDDSEIEGTIIVVQAGLEEGHGRDAQISSAFAGCETRDDDVDPFDCQTCALLIIDAVNP